ncbi:expressed protein [Phakopsora pachyrhizi]|uniref:Expressed protein n=1 Tax=Phakopsora pachyrhizi TaxID=170000 RepID=A0AAV0BVF6_PHAPC|nr:expressed protein [Phakopsora pachyrhizi]
MNHSDSLTVNQQSTESIATSTSEMTSIQHIQPSSSSISPSTTDDGEEEELLTSLDSSSSSNAFFRLSGNNYSLPKAKPSRSRKSLRVFDLISKINDHITLIETRNDWNQLWINVQSLDQILINDEARRLSFYKTNAKFFPMIFRVFNEVDRLVTKVLKAQDKGFSKKLNRTDARGLANPPPAFINDLSIEEKPDDRTSKMFLSNLEKIIIGDSNQLSFSSSGLSEMPKILFEIKSILNWYLSFEGGEDIVDKLVKNFDFKGVGDAGSSRLRDRSEEVLKSIHILDLSNNKLNSIPDDLLQLFPSLSQLKLSNNPFKYLPPSIITRLPNLKRLELRSIRFRPSNSIELLNQALNSPPPSIPSLAILCLRKMYRSNALPIYKESSFLNPTTLSLSSEEHWNSTLLMTYLSTSSICESCDRLYLKHQLQDLFQACEFYSSLKNITIGPIRLCRSCLILHLGPGSSLRAASSNPSRRNLEDRLPKVHKFSEELSDILTCECCICMHFKTNGTSDWSV